ncbi:MAG: hypothetical protein RLZZ528_2580 [Pseudomonadota bacterium]|jgi:uncharacterized integral membrane protein
MLRALRLVFLLLLGLVLLVVAFANRGVVELRLLPEDMALFLGLDYRVELPLFLVIFGGVVAGLLIGFVWEWMREARQRAEAARTRREAATLSREVSRLRDKAAEPVDDVLALVEARR